MKIKIMKREKDIIIEYAREKNPHGLRYKILEYLADTSEDKILIYVDTNSKLKPMPISDIENILKSSETDYKCEAVESAKRGVFGFNQMIRPYKKNKRLTEHIILFELSRGADIKEIYQGFLSNYDYAVGIGADSPMSELILRLKSKAEDVLFNKEIFKNTVYDSIVIQRLRMDAPYDDFAIFTDDLEHILTENKKES